MSSAPIKKLDIVQEGIDPSDFEAWRKDVFSAIIGSRSSSGLAGSSLSFSKGHMDLNVLADSECPDDMTAVLSLTTFLQLVPGSQILRAAHKGPSVSVHRSLDSRGQTERLSMARSNRRTATTQSSNDIAG